MDIQLYLLVVLLVDNLKNINKIFQDGILDIQLVVMQGLIEIGQVSVDL